MADALVVERASLRRLPGSWPDVDRRLEVRASRDGFVRVAGVDRSWVPADVVLAPDHARQLRLARQAVARLAARDPAVATADLARYDQLAEVAP